VGGVRRLGARREGKLGMEVVLCAGVEVDGF